MAKHYSIKSFFRDVPAALLARYFHKRALFQDVDFAAMKGADREELFKMWLDLRDDERREMEGEFQEILAMSRDAAMPAIIHEAAWQMRNQPGAHVAFVEMFSALPNHHERAMVAFLDYHECWKGANLFYYADTLPNWRKRKGFPQKAAAVDDASVEELAGRIRTFFHQTEGRGDNCHIDCLRRSELDYFFAYPEDYSKQSNEYVGGKFAPRPHNPAFEIVYIYSQKDGSLDLNFRGDYRRVEALHAMFAQAILKLPELPPNPKNTRVYDLNQLSQKDFGFAFDPDSGIEQVTVKMLRLSSKVNEGDRITLEANADENPNGVYELLAKVGRSVPLHLYNVTKVELTASVVLKPGRKAKKVPIRITHPDSCSLKYDELGERLRHMLATCGIESKEPPEGAKA